MFVHSARKANGWLFGFHSDGKTTEHDTVQCVHCGCHWVVKPGSGTERGWCTSCHGPHCGSRQCFTCKPLEKWLEEVEKQASREFRLGV